MKAPRDPVAYLEALALALGVAFDNVRAIEDETPMCTSACGHLGNALTHLESARGCIQSARMALQEHPHQLAAE